MPGRSASKRGDMLQPIQAAAVPNNRRSQARRSEDSVFPLFPKAYSDTLAMLRRAA